MESESPSMKPGVLRFSEDVLEFPAVADLVGGHLSGPIARPLLEALQPHTDAEEIRRQLELVHEAREYARENNRPGFSSLSDPRPILAKLGIEGLSLTAHEILALVELARAARDLRELFRETPCESLNALAGALGDFRSLVASLDGKILPDGTLDSSASAELGRI